MDATYQGDDNTECPDIVAMVFVEEDAVVEYGKKVVEQDRWTCECYHKNGSTDIELAVDGEIPAGNVKETLEIKLFHIDLLLCS